MCGYDERKGLGKSTYPERSRQQWGKDSPYRLDLRAMLIRIEMDLDLAIELLGS